MTPAEILEAGYHSVVANPPYITCKSPEIREVIRCRYRSAHGNFGLGVPFTERLFQLAVPGGWVGEITSNAFCKREHGKILIEQVLSQLELREVIDTSGAFIPGHGTPTVILVGRNRDPQSGTVRAVRSKRGEPSTPAPSALAAWVTATARRLRPVLEALPLSAVDSARLVLALLSAQAVVHRGRSVPSWGPSEHCAAFLGRMDCLAVGTDWFTGTSAPSLSAIESESLRCALSALAPPPGSPDPIAQRGLGEPFCGPARSGWATWDTDWIGDLYQALCGWAVKNLAFVQTPRFVRDLILDRALSPAMRFYGLEGFRVIDPACGSGHLLLDAFWRVFLARTDPEEGPAEMLADTAARLAVTAIHGVDLNPEVVEITRLRLALAYCDAARISVERLPALPLRVEAGDSLLLGRVHPSPPPLRPVPVPVQLELLSRAISSRSEVAL